MLNTTPLQINVPPLDAAGLRVQLFELCTGRQILDSPDSSSGSAVSPVRVCDSCPYPPFRPARLPSGFGVKGQVDTPRIL